ncbi:MAG TPA: hypothetical protein VMW16_16840 [Sedimentisphaerales bacterium]|nr:hypothetical protein [Sedimentisphaerales bacterium]
MKSTRKKVVFFVIGLSLILAVVPVIAKGPSGPAGKSNVGHLYLVEKDPQTWDVIDEGAWGKIKYNLAGPEFDFVFNGHELEPDMDYTLIYYPDPWPGNGLICLGSDTADEYGNVHIKESVDTGHLPAPYDLNADPNTAPFEMTGAKIWLVTSADVNCTDAYMAGWTPTEYLFEYARIWFDATDAEE